LLAEGISFKAARSRAAFFFHHFPPDRGENYRPLPIFMVI
jgi:hypothetical protein